MLLTSLGTFRGRYADRTLAGAGWLPVGIFCAVFPKNADTECPAGDPDQHGLHTGRSATPHRSGVSHQSADHDDHGTHAFPVPSACTVLHPTGDTHIPLALTDIEQGSPDWFSTGLGLGLGGVNP